MSTTRSVRPTDLVALVSLDGRVYPNEARTWDSLGRHPEGPRILDSALVPWFSFATGRHTWISVQGQAILALISARQRGNRTAWEIDCLIAATDDEHAVCNLFDQAAAAAGGAGVQRIFLRLEAGSDLMGPARRAGFVTYTEEALLRLDGDVPSASLPQELATETRRPSDAFALYRLYNAAVPEAIRRIEAPTFQLWQAAAERRATGRGKLDLIVRRAGEAVAHLRACRDGSLSKIDIVVHPTAHEALPAFIDLACGAAGSQKPLFCLTPSHAQASIARLREAGFELDSEYIGLVKRTAMPVPVTRPANARATSPQPVVALSALRSAIDSGSRSD